MRLAELGLTQVHVNRTLQALKQEEVVAIQARTINVLDWDRLIRIGDFDPGYLHIGRVANEAQPVPWSLTRGAISGQVLTGMSSSLPAPIRAATWSGR